MEENQTQSTVATQAPAPAASPAPASAPQSPAPAPTSAAPEQSQPWYSGIQDENLRGYAELQGFQKPEDMITKFKTQAEIVEASKLNNALVLPSDPDDADGWNGVYNKLGRPEKPDEYGIKAPEGQSPEFANTTAQWMHEAGLNTKQAQALAGKWNEYAAAQQQAAIQAKEVEAKNQEESFRRERGSNADRDIELARRAFKSSGLQDGDDVAIYNALGAKKALEFFSKIGGATQEHTYHSSGQPVNDFGLTPEAARVRKSELLSDPAFKARYLNGDKAAIEKITSLTKAGM